MTALEPGTSDGNGDGDGDGDDGGVVAVDGGVVTLEMGVGVAAADAGAGGPAGFAGSRGGIRTAASASAASYECRADRERNAKGDEPSLSHARIVRNV